MDLKFQKKQTEKLEKATVNITHSNSVIFHIAKNQNWPLIPFENQTTVRK